MKFTEIQEACWSGYRQAGMKKKGDRQVPNCVPVEEGRWEKTKSTLMSQPLDKKGQEMAQALTDLEGRLQAVQAQAAGTEWEQLKKRRQLQAIGAEFDQLDRDIQTHINMKVASNRPNVKQARAQAIKQAAIKRKHGDPQTFDQRQQQSLKYFSKPAANPRVDYSRLPDQIDENLQETTDPFLDNWARDFYAMLAMFGIGFTAAAYYAIRNKLNKIAAQDIMKALQRRGFYLGTPELYDKVNPVLQQFRQAIQDNDGAAAKALAQKLVDVYTKEMQKQVMIDKLKAPEPQAQDQAVVAKEKELSEDLKKWFKEKWVRFGPDGKIRGACARGDKSEGKPKCLPQSKAHALGKKGRASAAAKKRREDPNAERRGPARNVATKVREGGNDDPIVKALHADDYGMPGTSYSLPKDTKTGYRVSFKGRIIGVYDTMPKATEIAKRLEQKYGGQARVEATVAEAANPAQQAAIAIAMKKAGKKPQAVKETDWPVNTIPAKSVVQGYTVEYDPSARKVSISRGGQLLNQFTFKGTPNLRSFRNSVDLRIGQLLDAQHGIDEAQTDYQKRRQRERDVDAGRPVKPVPKNPKTDWEKKRAKEKQDIDEKQDACYRKVKSRYKVWPSAYASGALVQCRKKGAANWGNKKK